jgi:hypothetical protein
MFVAHFIVIAHGFKMKVVAGLVHTAEQAESLIQTAMGGGDISGGSLSPLPVVEDTFWGISNRYNATTAGRKGYPRFFRALHAPYVAFEVGESIGSIQGRIIPILFGPMPSSGDEGRTGRGQAGTSAPLSADLLRFRCFGIALLRSFRSGFPRHPSGRACPAMAGLALFSSLIYQ